MEMKRPILIFGGGGQDGFFLRDFLKASGSDVEAYDYYQSQFPSIDVGDFTAVSQIIKEKKPGMIFNLAARSTTKHEALLDNQNAIVNGTVSILEAVDRFAPDCKVFLASSGLVFQNNGKPICEDDPLALDSAYALTRAEALLSARYFRQRGRKVFVGFLFNHESPLRPPASVVRQVVADVVRVSRGSLEKIKLGNANVVKEWTWAGDTVQAMITLINQDEIFEANIGSGVGYSIREFATECSQIFGLELNDHIEEMTGFVPQYPSLISDPSRIKSLGWKPHVGLNELARKMVEAEIQI